MLLALAGVSVDEIAVRLAAPLAWARGVVESPTGQAELKARRREVLSRVQGAAAVVATRGLALLHDGMAKDPENVDLAAMAVRAASPLIPKTLDVNVEHSDAGSAELQDQISWLLQQAERNRLALEMGSAAVLDAVIIEDEADAGPYDDLL